MKVIDLLNKIANGEEVPKWIVYDGKEYSFDEEYKDYVYIVNNNGTMFFLLEGIFRNNISTISLNNLLNREFDFIEEPKKINKIRIDYNSINIDKAFETGTTTFFREKDIEIFQCLSSKINEIIDYINKEV